jgi:hypothetical protein
MDVDANHRTRRAVILAGVAAFVVIAAVIAGMTWLSARPTAISTRPTVTPSGSSPTVTPSGASPSGASPTVTPSGASPSDASPSGAPPSAASPSAVPDLAGSWDSVIGVHVTFATDGTWSTIGGCNSGTGTWRAATNGSFTATITHRTRLPCPLTAGSDGVPAGDMMLRFLQSAARVTATAGSGRPAITLIDGQGGSLVVLTRSTATALPSHAGTPTPRTPTPGAPMLRARAASGNCPTCSA